MNSELSNSNRKVYETHLNSLKKLTYKPDNIDSCSTVLSELSNDI